MPVEGTSLPRSLLTNDRVPGTKPRQSELPAPPEPLASQLVPSCFRSRVRPKNLIGNSCSRSRDLAKPVLGSRIWLLRIFPRSRANMHPRVAILPSDASAQRPPPRDPMPSPPSEASGRIKRPGERPKVPATASHERTQLPQVAMFCLARWRDSPCARGCVRRVFVALEPTRSAQTTHLPLRDVAWERENGCQYSALAIVF